MNLSKVFILILLPLVGVFTSHISIAQNAEHKEKIEDYNGGHKLTIIMANALIDNSFSDETNDLLLVPAIGLNYDYFINSKWGLGIHSDILIQQFKIEKHGHDEEIIRENPISVCGMLLFKPHHRWTLFTGYGVEMEKNENFQLFRLGTEYAIDLPKKWEVEFSLEFDYKPDAYNTVLFGIGFSKLFSKK
jgi:hypothetical protein